MGRPDITLHQCACLAAIDAARSFRNAAERLGLSQPSLSAQIRALEGALGVTLVERRSTGAALTPVGRDILDHAERVLAAARDLADAAASARARLSGTLRLGVSPTIGPYLLPEVMGRLRRTHPDLSLSVREAPPRELGRALVEGRHDAALLHLPVREDGLDAEELFRERLMLMLAADHPLAQRAVVTPEDLLGLDVLTLDERYQLHDQVAGLCAAFGARLSDAYEAASLDALRRMTAMGAGVAFAPELYVRSEVRPGGDVAARPIRGRALFRRIGLARRRSAPHLDSISAVGRAARESFAALTAPPLADGRPAPAVPPVSR
jgi:LysR family hydrogen peroxide-inducible transcriptional activator